MILPSIVSVSVTALNARRNMSRAAWPGCHRHRDLVQDQRARCPGGIAAGIVLGIGRAIIGAPAVMMVAGNSPNMPDSVFRSVTFLTTAIAKK